MRTLLWTLVAALAAGTATAKDVSGAAADSLPTVQNAPVARTVYICDTSAMTRRAFTREFGAVEYVTAAQAAAKDATWQAPKCMKPTEARKLRGKQLASAR